MTRHEAERLLGGYATGTLTEEEKSALFSAALDHQELFDALVDEEALRELLADPVARRRLLALLPREEAVRAGLWAWLRRPAAIGLAASLAGAALVGVALWRYGAVERPGATQIARLEQAPPAQSVQKKQESVQPPPETQAKRARQGTSRDNEVAAPLLNAPRTPQPAIAASREEAKKAEASVQVAADLAVKQSAPEAGVVGGVVGGVPVPSPLVPTTQESTRPAALLDQPAPERAASLRKQPVLPDLKAKTGAVTLAAAREPSYVLERREGDTARLMVKSPSGGNIYVVKRAAGGPEAMLAQRSVVGPAGTIEAVYEFPLSPTDAVDLYVLPSPEENPAALPPGGPSGAFVRRVYPKSKINPPVR